MTKNTQTSGAAVYIAGRIIDTPEWVASVAQRVGISTIRWDILGDAELQAAIHELGDTDR